MNLEEQEGLFYNEGEDDDLLPPPSSWFQEGEVPTIQTCSRDRAHPDNKAVPCSHDPEIVGELESPRLTEPFSPLHVSQLDSFNESSSPPSPSVSPTPEENGQHFRPRRHQHQQSKQQIQSLPAPRQAPSWSEISYQVLPAAAKELLTTSLHRILHSARLSYSNTAGWYRKHSDLGNNAGGYFRYPLPSSVSYSPSSSIVGALTHLPPFSSLSWVDRQLVAEWRTISTVSATESHTDVVDFSSEDSDGELFVNPCTDVEKRKGTHQDVVAINAHGQQGEDDDQMIKDDDDEFYRARTLVPQPIDRPVWARSDMCFECNQPFGPTLLRHHCRLCGHSFCQAHSPHSHRLPHLGYDPNVPERVCAPCKRALTEQNLAERIAWRLARCRDYLDGDLTPYFETGVDTVEDAAMRITQAAIAMAKSIPLGAQATIAVETVDVLRKHGLKGIYGIILRKEFLAAADLLCKALGINKTSWPLSVHELSAAIFYALAQHRAMRGMNPEREHMIHALRNHIVGSSEERDNQEEELTSDEWGPFCSAWTDESLPHEQQESKSQEEGNCVVDKTDRSAFQAPDEIAIPPTPSKEANGSTVAKETGEVELPFDPVCDPVPDHVLSSVMFYAPIALNFIYATRETDMQLLAAQQGWRLVYAHLIQEAGIDSPASALFCHDKKLIACLAIRGTSTINDVVTDIRQMPVSFPESMEAPDEEESSHNNEDWLPVVRGKGLAVCGMSRAAVNLFREHIDALESLVRKGYRLRVVGHSLGGGVATLLGTLVLNHLEQKNLGKNGTMRVYGYGTPSCVDARLSDEVKPFVTTVVLHDDVIPRLTPTSIRGLLKHLLHIRETWVKAHLTNDLLAITERARTAWAPRWRQAFTLEKRSFQRYCHKQIQFSKITFLSVKGKIVEQSRRMLKVDEEATMNTACDTFDVTEQQRKDEEIECDEHDPVPSLIAMPETEFFDGQAAESAEAGSYNIMEGDGTQSKMLVDMMGGIDCRTNGVVIDGDHFFDAEEDLVESDDIDDHIEHVPIIEAAEDEAPPSTCSVEDESWANFDNMTQNRMSESGMSSLECAGKEGLEETDETTAAVVLEEIPLPRMFLPGRVVHIYTHRGGYKAAFVPRAFRELRRISLAGNMLTDHTCKAYYEALLEVKSVRDAVEGLPRWTAFDEDMTCSCCASKFTWASTSDSEAQEARDKHNCRSCGCLVCNPCSDNRLPLPSIGITVPVRVCDRCYNDFGGIAAESRDSFIDEDPILVGSNDLRPSPLERKRERRSAVVDELAIRIQSTVTRS